MSDSSERAKSPSGFQSGPGSRVKPLTGGVGLTVGKTGWIAVGTTSEEGIAASVGPSVADTLRPFESASLVVAQVPIGLRERSSSERGCDPLAREVVGQRSSVFRPACRQAIYEATYEAANATNRRVTGVGLARQAWGLSKRIRELDEYLATRAAGGPEIRETHCDIAFWALNGMEPLEHNQRLPEGVAERREVLRRHVPNLDQVLAALSEEQPRVQEVRWLIALACAVTASAPEHELFSLPENPERDARGLRMEMVYRRLGASPFLAVPESQWLASDELAFAVRDGFPVSPGHTLIVPRRVFASWFEATAEEQASIVCLIDRIKDQLDQQTPRPGGYNIGINVGEAAGQTVKHLHVHVIPRYAGDVEDPTGGVRNVIPGKGNYLKS
jgi:predicted RNase H-like nuclease/diadenosine tetraphosphate (Ap4A) HIT family hydrolase